MGPIEYVVSRRTNRPVEMLWVSHQTPHPQVPGRWWMKRHRNYGDIMGTLTLVLYGGDISLSIFIWVSIYIWVIYIYTHIIYIYISYIITGDIYIWWLSKVFPKWFMFQPFWGFYDHIMGYYGKNPIGYVQLLWGSFHWRNDFPKKQICSYDFVNNGDTNGNN